MSGGRIGRRIMLTWILNSANKRVTRIYGGAGVWRLGPRVKPKGGIVTFMCLCADWLLTKLLDWSLAQRLAAQLGGRKARCL